MSEVISYEVKSSLGTFQMYLKSSSRHSDGYVLYHEANRRKSTQHGPAFFLKYQHFMKHEFEEVLTVCKDWTRDYLKRNGVTEVSFRPMI
jgi:hypothetical protein